MTGSAIASKRGSPIYKTCRTAIGAPQLRSQKGSVTHRDTNNSRLLPPLRIYWEANGSGSFTIEKFRCRGTYFLFGNVEINRLACFLSVPLDHICRGAQSPVKGFTAGSVYIADLCHEMVSLVFLYFFTTKSALHLFLQPLSLAPYSARGHLLPIGYIAKIRRFHNGLSGTANGRVIALDTPFSHSA
jgi:hypothetical protein